MSRGVGAGTNVTLSITPTALCPSRHVLCLETSFVSTNTLRFTPFLKAAFFTEAVASMSLPKTSSSAACSSSRMVELLFVKLGHGRAEDGF